MTKLMPSTQVSAWESISRRPVNVPTLSFFNCTTLRIGCAAVRRVDDTTWPKVWSSRQVTFLWVASDLPPNAVPALPETLLMVLGVELTWEEIAATIRVTSASESPTDVDTCPTCVRVPPGNPWSSRYFLMTACCSRDNFAHWLLSINWSPPCEVVDVDALAAVE